MGLTITGDEKCETEPKDLVKMLDEDTALVTVQYPDFFGNITDLSALGEAAQASGALFCVVVNPLALGMLVPPGDFGADIVVGDGQPLGISLSYGGPTVGIFTTKDKYVRKMAGRLVGETVDSRGQRGYVLTLTPREQHIRRDKATSNICTNQGLMALASAVYLSVMGKQGLRRVAELCYHKAHYAAEPEINERLLEWDILGGFDLGQEYPDLKDHMLIAVTEVIAKEEIDDLVAALEEVSND